LVSHPRGRAIIEGVEELDAKEDILAHEGGEERLEKTA
jgi:hypothetical protein